MAAVRHLQITDVASFAVTLPDKKPHEINGVINRINNAIIISILSFIKLTTLKKEAEPFPEVTFFYLAVHHAVFPGIIIFIILINRPPPQRPGKYRCHAEYI